MRFQSPLLPGRLVRRYKRFLADVILDGGQAVTAACPNTGAMLGLTAPGAAVWLSKSANALRKYPHTWEMVECGLSLVGLNTGLPNALAAEAIAAGLVPELSGYETIQREIKYGRASRIDILLSKGGRRAYVEVKNAHLMRRRGRVEWPDCVTARGLKHLGELADMARAGHRAALLFVIQRADAKSFAIAADLDPAYADAFAKAQAQGVEALAYRCRISPEEVAIDRAVPIRRGRRL